MRGRESYSLHSYLAALNEASRNIVWLVEIKAARYAQVYRTIGPLYPNATVPNATLLKGIAPTVSTVTLRWASRPIVTAASDSPAKTFIDGRLVPPTIFKELGSINDGVWSSIVRYDVGEVELSNADGELDNIAATYKFEGRPFKIYAGACTVDAYGVDQSPSLASMAVVYVGEVERWSYSRNAVRLIVRNRPAGFDKLIKGSEYAGHGGSAGSQELAGIYRPIAFGTCLNVPPVLIDQDELIYQVNDGEIRDIVAVRVAGAKLTFVRNVETYDELVALLPAGSEEDAPGDIPIEGYATCLAEGYFKLGSSPYDTVTVDLLGSGGRNAGASGLWEGSRYWEGRVKWQLLGSQIYRNKAAGLAGEILNQYGGMTISRYSFDEIDKEYGLISGLYIGPNDSLTVSDAVERLLMSVPAILNQDINGSWFARPLLPPSGESKTVLTDLEILRSSEGPEIERPDLPYGRPWPSWRVGYRRNWRPMTENELVGIVMGDERVFLTQQTREARAIDGLLLALYSDRPGAALDTYLEGATDAEGLISRLFTLYSSERRMFRIKVKGQLFLYDIGDVVSVNHRRHGLSGVDELDIGLEELDIDSLGEDLLISTGPQKFIVVGLREDGIARTTELTLWG